MNTILKPMLNKSILRIGGIALTVFLSLSMMAAVLPQTAQAAGSSTAVCSENYVVKKGDTKGMIADTFGLKWWQIAAANNMLPYAKPVVGKTLCIPTLDWAKSANFGTMTASANGKKLTVQMSGFNVRSVWNVKVKDGTGGMNDYFKVGRIIAPKNGSVTGVSYLPHELWKTPRLDVCVTNATTSITSCTRIDHTV
jgi:hypothetical protein